jgi:integrase
VRFVDQLIAFPVLRVVAIVCGCLGLRISETLALRWSDLDFVSRRLKIERSIVRQVEDEVKTEGSQRIERDFLASVCTVCVTAIVVA